MFSDIVTILLSPAVIVYWALRYSVGLSTPFDDVVPAKKSLFKIVFLGAAKRLGQARFTGNRFTVPKTLYKLMQTRKAKYPNYALAGGDLGNWLVKPYDFDPANDPCLVYSHGGGYMFRMNGTQLTFIERLYESLVEQDPEKFSKLAVFLIDYETTLEGKYYPSQFNHGIKVWNTLVEQGFRNMYLMGDSAGGHMCLNILQSLEEQPPNSCVWPLKTVLISPWLNTCANSQETGISMENEKYDYLSPSTGNPFGTAYVQNAKDPWNDKFLNILYNASATDWNKVKTQFLFTAGSHETPLKAIKEFSHKIGATLAIDEGGIHDGPAMYEPVLYATREDWLSSFGAQTLLEFFKS